jgi:hypothetical protein
MTEDSRYVFFGRRHPDANIFLRLEQRLCDTQHLVPTALVNTGGPRTVRTQPTTNMS